MISMTSNFDSFADKLTKQFSKDLSFATSKALERAVEIGVDAGEKLAEQELTTNGLSQQGGPMIGGLRKKGLKAGLVRGWFPKQGQTLININKGPIGGDKFKEARVFIVNNDDPAKTGRSFDMVDEMYPLVFGGRAFDESNIPGTKERGIITPTTALMKGLSGRGRLKGLNKFGNLAGLKRGLPSVIGAQDKSGSMFLNVPINNTDKRTAHLPAGLYFRVREVLNRPGSNRSIDKKLTRQHRVLTDLERRGGKRVRSNLVILLAYHTERQFKAQFPFNTHVRAVMRSAFITNNILQQEMFDAFVSSLAKGRYGTRRFS